MTHRGFGSVRHGTGAPAGAVVSLYVDLVETVRPTDVIETQTGRRYRVLVARFQSSGSHVGRQHLRVIVLAPDEPVEGATIHRIRWYRRRRSNLIERKA